MTSENGGVLVSSAVEVERQSGWLSRVTRRLIAEATSHRTLALLDQACVSAANLATTVIIVRACGEHVLGLYSLGLTIVLLISVLNESLITLPYVVFTHQFEGEDRTEYAGSVLIHQIVLAHVVAVGLALAAVVGTLGLLPEGLAPVLAVLADCLFLLVLREFARRVAYAHLQLGAALLLDIAVTVIQGVALLGLAWAGLLSARTAHGVIGVAGGIVAGAWLIHERQTFRFRWRRWLPDWHRGWKLGSWEAGSRMIAIGRAYAPLWLMGLMMGVEYTGAFAACLTVVMLSNPFIIGISNLLVPQAARAVAEGGRRELGRVVLRVLALTVVVMGGFTVVLAFFGVPLVELMSKKNYSDYAEVIALLALTQFAGALVMLIYQSLTTMEETRFNFFVSIFSLLFTVAAVAALIPAWGVRGAAWGNLIGVLVDLLIRSTYFIHLTRVREADPATSRAGRAAVPAGS
jgi:O-antigen/teichoic acid export membrane protein